MTQSVTLEPKMSSKSTAFKTITATRLTPFVGAEISGVDLTKPMSQEQVAELKTALETYLVIFFRDQHLAVDDSVFMTFEARRAPPSSVLSHMNCRIIPESSSSALTPTPRRSRVKFGTLT